MRINQTITGLIVLSGLFLGALAAGIMVNRPPRPTYAAPPAQEPAPETEVTPPGETALSARNSGGRVCSATALVQYNACQSEVRDDFLTAQALCMNLSEQAERNDCFSEARDEIKENRQLCRDQYAARKKLCSLLGEARYDPDFDPANFDDDFTQLTNPNPYFPLGIGNRWKFVEGDETVTVEVLNKTKLIEGVTCIVVNDLVEVAGQPVEDTDDWFAQAKDGTVVYCGESVRDFEVFPGDNPPEPELVTIDGSFKAGQAARPGTLFLAGPTVGAVYRQEWAPGDAEDAAEVLSTSYSFGNDPAGLDQFVPPALAQLLCGDGDCVVTGEFNPLEPEALARKYYAPGLGPFLEVNPATGDILQLVECNFEARCSSLPAP
jgi:hypothetical protein